MSRQLTGLSICHLMPYVIGNALLPLLPVYTEDLGADATLTGLYLAIAFAALAAGTLGSGWLSDRFERRKQMIILVGLIAGPSIVLMGKTESVAVLTIFTVIVWFCGGVTTAMVNILAGMYADVTNRGRVFGTIGLTIMLGQIIGGLASGPIVDRWGYETLFWIVAVTQIIQVIAAALLLEEQHVAPAGEADTDTITTANTNVMSAPFVSLLIATLLVYTVLFINGLGRPLLMNDLGFDATALTFAVGISGFFLLPLPYLAGSLSDRIGRRQLLILGYIAVAAGTLLLIPSSQLWHFTVSNGLIATLGVTYGIGSALVTDLVPAQKLSTGLSRYASIPWIGGLIGFGAGGLIIDSLGIQTTLILAGIVPLISVWLILNLRQPSIVIAPEV